MVIVKLNQNRGRQLQFEDPSKAAKVYLNQLDRIDFGDNIKRGIVFSSGKSVYFGNKELIDNIRHQFFKTKPDYCCRYGSLLVSSCLEGAAIFDNKKDNSPIRLKIVDSQSDDPQERKEAADYFTGDCHGKISPQLAREIGAKNKRPFQFRMAWMTDWNKEKSHSTPNISFLAKGTFLPNQTLTEDRGYDIILDHSSIKGIAKKNQLIVTPTSRFPQISQEIRHANEPAEYPQVVKRDKTDYSKPKYTNLKQIAAAIKQNSIGYVATLIGRVQSSSNPYQKPDRKEKFESAQRQLLGKLFDALPAILILKIPREK
ncbi:hypothetical protein ACLFKQ_27880 [Myxosarcina sp. GI1(2024)]